MNSKSAIPISALVTAGTITIADIQHNGKLPGSREWLGFVVVFTMISAASDLGAPFANGFAILIMISALLTRGLDAFKFVNTKVEKPKAAKGNRKKTVPNKQPSEPTLA